MMMRALTIAGYALCGVAAAVLVVIGQLRPGRLAPLGRLLDRVFASRAARVVIMVFWFWLGWHFFVAGA